VAARIATGPADVTAVVVLAFDDALPSPGIQRVRGGEVVSRLLDALIRFDLAAALWDHEFELLAEVGSRAGLLRLARPKSSSAQETAALVARIFYDGVRDNAH
jgi:hypothetical protein